VRTNAKPPAPSLPARDAIAGAIRDEDIQPAIRIHIAQYHRAGETIADLKGARLCEAASAVAKQHAAVVTPKPAPTISRQPSPFTSPSAIE